MKIEIDKKSGFCFGVVNAIDQAEKELQNGETLYCLGDIVHNGSEVNRLEKSGLITINHEEFAQLHDVKVLLRAHGEPPSTYEIAKKNNITIIDATCPVVLKLQHRVKTAFDEQEKENQIVIFGKQGHAEVNGLVGQTEGKAIVVEHLNDLNKIDLNKGVSLFSQTTKSVDEFNDLVLHLKENLQADTHFTYIDTICRQVSNRIPNIKLFAQKHTVILFVSGKKSSNGKVLFEECKQVNVRSYFISEPDEIQESWFEEVESVGICGATSTPKWLMEDVAAKVETFNQQ